MNIKILVCCHEPSILPNDNFIVPINGGRALLKSKLAKKQITQAQYDWMLENTIGDDTGDNISELNAHFCELTAIYWAWKNYEKLGNPEYIGLSHYRRLFDTNEQEIEGFVSDNQIIGAFEKVSGNTSILEEFNRYHRPEDMECALNSLQLDFPEYLADANEYLNKYQGYFFNMFIMKKDVFFEYCTFLFSTIMKIHKISDYGIYSAYGSRLQGFIAERLTGIFIYHKKKQLLKVKDTKVKFIENPSLVDEMFPINDNDFERTLNLVLASDDNYCPHLETTIISVLENSDNANLYCFYIINKQLSVNNKQALKTIESRYKNSRIVFVQIDNYLDDFFKYNVKVSDALNHISIETFYRIYIPKIFKNFDKVLWLDCDLVVNHEITEIFEIDINNNQVAACLDIELARMRSTSGGEYDNYLKNDIGLRNPNLYFQAGVILFNVQECIKKNFLQNAKDTFEKHPVLRNNDQDLLNIVCQGSVVYLDPRWNYEWHVEFQTNDVKKELSLEFYEKLILCKNDPYIVHFSSCWKPWKDVNNPYAYLYWKYAIKSILTLPHIVAEHREILNGIESGSIRREFSSVNQVEYNHDVDLYKDEFSVYQKLDFIDQHIKSLKKQIFWNKFYRGLFCFLPSIRKKLKKSIKVRNAELSIFKRKQIFTDSCIHILKTTNLFDKNWYISKYKNEVILDPYIHFLEIGWTKGYSPSPLFDVNRYLTNYEDVRSARINPLIHYELFGKNEGRQIFEFIE